MNGKSRIYGKKVDINKENVKKFWDNRSDKYSKENPYNTVKCNDNNSEYMKDLDEYEKNIIFPKLDINSKSKVLDIGCGIGRLAEIFKDNCQYYLGTDFSEKLINIAKSRIALDEKIDLEVCEFKDICRNEVALARGKFDKILLAGVAMYINDDELKLGFEKLLNLISQNACIYISGPIGTKERVTLDKFYSEGLNTEYNVIYRTIDEYEKLFEVFFENGFKVKESKIFLSEKNQYIDTERHYFILTRDEK